MGAVNYHLINSKMLDRRKAGASPSEIFYEITTLYPAHDLPVNEKVELLGLAQMFDKGRENGFVPSFYSRASS